MSQTILDVYKGFFYKDIQPASIILMAKEEGEPQELIDDMYEFFDSKGYSKEDIDDLIQEFTEYED